MKSNASRTMRRPGRRDQWLQWSATALFSAALAVLLVLGMSAAARLQAASSALQSTAQLSGQPELISAELTLIQHGLETTTYVGGPLRTLTDLRHSNAEVLSSVQLQLQAANLQRDADITSALTALRRRWGVIDAQLAPLRTERGVEIYADTPSGSELSVQGRAMKSTVDALLATQTDNLHQFGSAAARLDASLHAAVDAAGLRLRELLHLEAPAGLHIESILKPLVDAKTLTAALKFLRESAAGYSDAGLTNDINCPNVHEQSRVHLDGVPGRP